MSAPYYQDEHLTLHHGDALDVLRRMDAGSVDCIVTSPPYYRLRDYGVPPTEWPEVTYAPIAGAPTVTIPPMVCALGAETDPAAFVAHLMLLFREARRVLADDGTLWLNLGDSYSSGSGGQSNLAELGRRLGTGGGHKADSSKVRRAPTAGTPPKNLLGIPWRVAFALQDDGWILRNDIIWAKPNAMPESVTDRLSTRHEHLFLLTKSRRYWFDLDAVREPHVYPDDARVLPRAHRGQTSAHPDHARAGLHAVGRNPGDVWAINTVPFPGAHFAVFPPALAERCVLAGCRPGGNVLDPFSGSGTTGLVAAKHGRRYVGIDLNADYLDLSLRTRLQQPGLDLEGIA